MITKTNPINGSKLSILGFGCMRFPTRAGMIDEKPAKELLLSAINQGINYLDTAYIYHKGQSESFVGKVLEEENMRERVYIATKLPPYLVRNSNDIEKIFQTQLKRLRTDRIDYYLIHMLQDLASWERLCSLGIEEWIERKQQSGEINQIGFSFHGNVQEFLKILDAYPWQFCQIQYNYLDENTQAGKKGLMAAAAKGLPVICMEPLRGGRLADQLPTKAASIFHQTGKTPVEWALRWVWNHAQITVLLSGMSTMQQLSENVATANSLAHQPLSETELKMFEDVRAIIHQSVKVGCTGCGYCVPCPVGVDIPTCFALYNEQFTTLKANKFKYIQATGAMGQRPGNASKCINCRKCVPLCPQQIPIPEKLSEVAKHMETFPFGIITRIARKIM